MEEDDETSALRLKSVSKGIVLQSQAEVERARSSKARSDVRSAVLTLDDVDVRILSDAGLQRGLADNQSAVTRVDSDKSAKSPRDRERPKIKKAARLKPRPSSPRSVASAARECDSCNALGGSGAD